MKFRFTKILLGLACGAMLIAHGPALLAKSESAPTSEVPLDDFFKQDKYLDIKISPTGKYLAASVIAKESSGALVILRRDDMKVTATMSLGEKTFISQFAWVNDDRVVFSIAERGGSLAAPGRTGELFAADAEGGNQKALAGARAKTGGAEFVTLVNTLPDDDKNVLVMVSRAGTTEGAFPMLERMNVYTGARTRISRAPMRNAAMFLDHQMQARFAVGSDEKGDSKLHYRKDDQSEWVLLHDETETGTSMGVIGFSPDDSIAYLESQEKAGPNTIKAYHVKEGRFETIFRHDTVDLLSAAYTRDGTPYAMYFSHGKPEVVLLEPELPEAKILSGLMSSFKDKNVSIRNFSKDGSMILFSVTSDISPPDFYMYEAKSGKATFLLKSRPWIKPEQMAPMKLVSLKARDGLTLHGYLTVPKGSNGKNLPLIVNPHGGPFGPFDDWGFNREVQLFANRGYAVLQVNFRGSGNYGRAFTHKGHLQWGGTMQDDLTDATHWAIKEGIADKNRICIYGASYGGYAAAMGIAKEPDLYRCAIGFVGVYDMNMMFKRGDIQQRDSGLNFLHKTLGKPGEPLDQISPNKLVDKIKAPIFIAAGDQDARAHPEHSKALRDALVKAGKTHEWLLNPNEAHGFFKLENNRELYSKMLAFFDKYIGPQPKSL